MDEVKASASSSPKSEKRRNGKAVLDCGRSISNSPVDHLRGVINRHSHPHVPEPEVAMIFRTKGSTEVDMGQLENQLKSAKREVCKFSSLHIF